MHEAFFLFSFSPSLLLFSTVRHLLGCLSRVVWWGEGTERVAGETEGGNRRPRERSREHGSGSAVSLGANESHLGGRGPGVSQQAFRLLEQLQHTVRPPLLHCSSVRVCACVCVCVCVCVCDLPG